MNVMNELLFAEMLCKSILKRIYEHYRRESLDDMEYIPIVKGVLNGLSDRLLKAGYSKSKVAHVLQRLKDYCKALYVSGWLKNWKEDRDEGDEDMDKARTEGENYFEHLYKYDRHPR